MSFTYHVTVYVPDLGGAGTNENVYFRLIGSQATSGDYLLDLDGYDDLEAPSHTTYEVVVDEYLGDIKEMYLYVEENSTDGPALYLDCIDVFTQIGGEDKTWRFNVYSWVGIPDRDPTRTNTINYLWIDHEGIYNKNVKSNEKYDKKSVGRDYDYSRRL
ncbi:hypothetical protein LCM14_23505 [Priestia aryabhattai]|uniref:PLAT/LH2 domain-containing protein n=1 Tax=Priestia aryabhattai TaxID=412384 RepID=UPI001CD4354A|nr:PLAT/LH2 domain-containing protein [Priestia aryabhattai]MCA1052792.1 hypothetical protein [Priestia aryabhattai]